LILDQIIIIIISKNIIHVKLDELHYDEKIVMFGYNYAESTLKTVILLKNVGRCKGTIVFI
jgi:hypothetical protein